MAPLPPELRGLLEKAVIDAREEAEKAARASVGMLAVNRPEPACGHVDRVGHAVDHEGDVMHLLGAHDMPRPASPDAARWDATMSARSVRTPASSRR